MATGNPGLELLEWARSTDFKKPWLMIGKGPTFSLRDEFDLFEYNTIGLNHVVREMKLDVAHAIDIEVIESCREVLDSNCRWLLMPRYPHVSSEVGKRPLEDYFAEYPELAHLANTNRLIWYNAATAHPVDGSPVIGVRFFSSEAALNILALLGARRVRTLGIDGGRSYSPSFQDLDDSTRLANGRQSFDAQFDEIQSIVEENKLDFESLVPPMRVFVGTDESQLLAARVLEYSIQKHASLPVQVTHMLNLPVPMPRDSKNQPRTGFSFSRFLIPELCGYSGRALYLDADMQVFGDIAELWRISFEDQKILCTFQDQTPPQWQDHPAFHPGRQTSVMMLDCEGLDWDIHRLVKKLDDGELSYEELVFELKVVNEQDIGDRLPPEWNHLEHYEPAETKLLHYTVMDTQPWKNDDNSLREIWTSLYREAVEAGAVPPEEVEESVSRGYVKRSLLAALSKAPGRRSPLTSSTHDGLRASERISQLEREVARLQGELDEVKGSTSFRLGSALVRPAARVRTYANRFKRSSWL